MGSRQRLLIDLCLANTGPGPQSLEGADMPVLMQWAKHLRVESYLLDQLGSVQLALGTETHGVMVSLRERVAESAVANLARDEALRELLTRFADSGIAVVLLKGTALRWERSGLAGRFQCDVDLLVRSRDLERAERVLLQNRYRFDASYQSREDYRRSHFHLPYRRDGVLIELHWDLDADAPAGFVERVWQESRALGGEPSEQSLRVPSPEHRLLFSCLHLSRHAFLHGLRWLADLRLDLPLSASIRRSFEVEASFWQPRAVYSPFWILAAHEVPGTDFAGHTIDAGTLDRLLLRSLLIHHIVGQPWLKLPLWFTEQVLRDWLYSEQSLVPLLAQGLREHLSRRVHFGNQPGRQPSQPPIY